MKKSVKILLIEDDVMLHKVLSERLKQEGALVEVAIDGEMAIAKALEYKPQIILLDIILPKKNGFEVLTELRSLPAFKKIPVVVLSNLGQDEDIKQMKDLGVKEYLVKADYSLTEMIEKINNHISKL